MRAVLDTNVLISGLLWRGAPHRCLLAAEGKLYELLLSEPIFLELHEKLTLKFGHTADEAAGIIAGIRGGATLVSIAGRHAWVPADPHDDKFVETAIEGHADLIVSGDHHLLDLGSVEGIAVISPRQFIDFLAANHPPELNG